MSWTLQRTGQPSYDFVGPADGKSGSAGTHYGNGDLALAGSRVYECKPRGWRWQVQEDSKGMGALLNLLARYLT